MPLSIIGFLTGGVGRWLVLGALLFMGFQHLEIEHYKSEYVTEQAVYGKFVVDTKSAGEQARADAKIKEASDKANKEKADHENAVTVATLKLTITSLRAANPASSFVPAAPAGSSRPDLICFDRALYIGTDGIFTEGARGLSDEGTAATVDLNTAKMWASGQSQVK